MAESYPIWPKLGTDETAHDRCFCELEVALATPKVSQETRAPNRKITNGERRMSLAVRGRAKSESCRQFCPFRILRTCGRCENVRTGAARAR